MKELTIGKNDAGQRLDRFLSKNLPLLPSALAQKYIRLKRIKVNGRKSSRDARLSPGDTLQLYINDDFFGKSDDTENLFLARFEPKVRVVYEDENLLLVDKRPGQSVHADETGRIFTGKASGTRRRNSRSRPRSATVSTAIPGGLSSPPKTPKRSGLSTRKSAPTKSRSLTSVSRRAARTRPRARLRAFCARTNRKNR